MFWQLYSIITMNNAGGARGCSLNSPGRFRELHKPLRDNPIYDTIPHSQPLPPLGRWHLLSPKSLRTLQIRPGAHTGHETAGTAV